MLKPVVSLLLRASSVAGNLPKLLVMGLIKVYRYCISPLMARHCRFYPTCSSYGLEALETYGFLKGSLLTVKRLLRCHPWHPGGFDPVPAPKCRHTRSESHKHTYHQESLARTSWICKEHS